MSQCEHRGNLPPDIGYNSPCPICALEKRVKEYGPMAAETINWANERIRAYRILGT